MNIPLDEGAVMGIIQQAILDSLGEEKRDLLIKSALAYLMEPQESGRPFDRTKMPSPLQKAFQRAAESACNQIVHQQLAEDVDFRRQVRDVVTSGWLKAIGLAPAEEGYDPDGTRAAFVDSISKALGKAFNPSRDW